MNAPTTPALKLEFTEITVTFPKLNPGEKWGGVVTTEAGLHHVVVLPGDNDELSWKGQTAWAQSIGGELPDRLELAMLRLTLPDEFKPDWYWSCEQPAGDESSAWYQLFGDGFQLYDDKDLKLRARAVRRIPIE